MSAVTEPPSRQAILDALSAQDSPSTADELAIQLHVGPEAIVGFRRRLAAMQRDGQVLQNRKGGLMLVSRIDLVAGKVAGHRDGFGFLLPDDGSGDLFLPPREMQKVMHGDRVLGRRSGVDSRGRAEASIVEVTARANRSLVGRLVNERGVLLVVPEDQRIKHDVLIQPGGTMGATPGQVVSAEITEPPSVHKPPIGRVVEILGEVDDPGMEIEIAVRKFDVPHQFSAALLAEVGAIPDALRAADYKDRVDLRDLPLVTIDGEDARDFDDAVYCEPLEPPAAGKPAPGWRLLVAIADVSHYVTPGSLLDREAQARTTSVYFPRRVIPMLPEKLSNGLCSLNPQVDRLVLVADMVIDLRGRIKAYQFYPAVMHSAARLTYDEVWGILSGRDPAAAQRRAPLVAGLNDLHRLFRALLKARTARGAIEFETVETKILCDPSGRIQSIVAQERNDAHRLIEECMLAANTCAADLLVRKKHPGLYRVHEGPTPDRLARLREFLAGVGLKIGSGDGEPTPADYQALSQKIAGRPDAMLLQTMMLRSMQQAIYTPINSGHFGLAYDAYAHFTSPIRRYPDLLNHRAIKAVLDGRRYQPVVLGAAEAGAGDGDGDGGDGADGAGAAGKVVADEANPLAARRSRGAARGAGDLAAWDSLGLVSSVNERRADEATRDVEAWLKCQYMRERVGEQYRGRITGVAPFGIFVTLESLYVEGMVHVSELGSDYFQFNETSHELRGERTGRRYRLTDEIDVQVSRVNLEGRRIDFRLVPEEGGRAASSAIGAGSGRDGSGDGSRGDGARAAGRGTGVGVGGGRGGGTPVLAGGGGTVLAGRGSAILAGGAAGSNRGDGERRVGRKAARGKTAAIREAQAARKAARGRGAKKSTSNGGSRGRRKR
ncbi:MAG: ribonuclease R [Lautropia sp.]